MVASMISSSSRNVRVSCPPNSNTLPPGTRPSTASAIAVATSPANTGWNFVTPPPSSGSAGDTRAMAAKRLKK